MLIKLFIISILSIANTQKSYIIPVGIVEHVRVWCQGDSPKFGDCNYRGITNCYQDFGYTSDLPVDLSCIDDGYTVKVMVVRENFRQANLVIRQETVRINCLEETDKVEIRAQREGKKTPRIKWASTTRTYAGQVQKPLGDISKDEHMYQKFYVLKELELDMSDDEAYLCNGTKFNYNDYKTGQNYTTPSTVAKVTYYVESDDGEGDGGDEGTEETGKYKEIRAGLSPMYLVIIITCIVLALSILCTSLCCLYSKTRKAGIASDRSDGTISSVYPTSLNEPLVGVLPTPRPSLVPVYEEADNIFHPRVPCPAYDGDSRLPPTSYDNQIQLLRGRQGKYQRLDEPETPTYSEMGYEMLNMPSRTNVTQGYMELERAPLESQYEVLGGGQKKFSVDNGYRYNVLNRGSGFDETDQQYNVLRRTE